METPFQASVKDITFCEVMLMMENFTDVLKDKTASIFYGRTLSQVRCMTRLCSPEANLLHVQK
jgi:hypothetical protein